MKKIQQSYKNLQKKTHAYKVKILSYIDKEPIKSFYIALGALIVFIILGNIIRTPKKVEKKEEVTTKEVSVYRVGASSNITTTAHVEKEGIIQIEAQTSGIVSNIYVTEGSKALRGKAFLTISSNYQGGNSFATQAQIASVQYKNVVDTYDAQRDSINKQKDIASKTDENSDKLTDITKQSIDETKSLISLNDNIIASIDTNLKTLELDPVTNAATILSTKQLKSQFLAAANGAKAGLRQSEYSTNGDNPPTKLSDAQREITVNQLDRQLKMLDVNREVSRLQSQLAGIAAGMTRPSAPYNGVVQKIMVRPGQLVNPGTPLIIFTRSDRSDQVMLSALVSREIAPKISKKTPSIVTISNNHIELYPSFVTTEAVSGNLYGVYFKLPKEYKSLVDDKDTLAISIPLLDDTKSSDIYIPIDAIHQTSDGGFVYIVQKNKAKAQKITIEKISGSLVTVSGLNGNEDIILDRTVLDGTKITVLN